MSKTIYVMVPVKAIVEDGEVRLLECPTPQEVGRLAGYGFWEDSIGAEVALRYGKSACPPCLDKVLKGE